MELLFAVLALLAGVLLTVQVGANTLLRVDLGAPITVGAISFIVATAGMALVLLFVVATGTRRSLCRQSAEGMYEDGAC